MEQDGGIGVVIGIKRDFAAFDDGMLGVLLDASFQSRFVFGREGGSDDVSADGQRDLILGYESELLCKTGVDLISDGEPTELARFAPGALADAAQEDLIQPTVVVPPRGV